MSTAKTDDRTAGSDGTPADAAALWRNARPCVSHPFLDENKIRPFTGVRVHESSLVIPLYSAKRRFANVMLIDAKGRVSHLIPWREAGVTYFLFGTKADLARTKTICICDGWANGWTIHDASGSVVVGPSWRSDLFEVAESYRRAFPKARLVICANNERWSYFGWFGHLERNLGLDWATSAAKRVGGSLAIPDFADLEGKPTGFNDLRLREGSEAVLRWLNPENARYAQTQAEGHDVIDRVCSARLPGPDGASLAVGAVIGQVVRGRSAKSRREAKAVKAAMRLLGTAGLKVEDEHVLLSNKESWLHERLGKRWPDRRWLSLLRELPDVEPTDPRYFARNLTSRATAVPICLFSVPQETSPNSVAAPQVQAGPARESRP